MEVQRMEAEVAAMQAPPPAGIPVGISQPVPSHATLIHINQLLREVLGHPNQFLRGAGQVPVQVVVHGLRCNCEECYATTESESE